MYNKNLLIRFLQGLILVNLILSTNYISATNFQAFAQSAGSTTANLTGLLTDPDTAAIGGATITAKNIDTNFSREVVSDENGSFTFSQLPPGNYEITISATGFRTQAIQANLALGITTRLDFILKIGGQQEIIEVIANNLLEEGKTESSTNINQERINSLPLNRRNFLDLSLTTARVTTDRLPIQGASATSGLSVNGQPARFNNITIDGLDNNDGFTGSVRSTFSQDAIQEFQVVSDGYSAEFGRAIGGVINIVTKGGTNELHGSLFGFIRNDKTSAKDTFSSIEPDYKQYQFGASLAGPIKKDKALYFTSFERLSVAQNFIVSIRDSTVKAAKSQGFILDNGPRPSSLANSSFLARTDFRLNSRNTLYVRYNFGGVSNGALELFGGLTGQTNAGSQRLADNSIAISNTYVNSNANFINETRFLFNHRKQTVDPLESGPLVRLIAPEGRVTFGRNTFLPQLRLIKNYQIVDNITLTRGNNTIKFGVDFEYVQVPKNKNTIPIFLGGFASFTNLDFRAATGNPELFFSAIQAFDPSQRTAAQRAFLTAFSASAPTRFPGFPSGVQLADIGLPVNYIQGFGDVRVSFNNTLLSLFVQDDIKLKPNLLVKLGLRYDRVRVDTAPKNNGNFSPRVAFSYQPKAFGGIRLHGSYGLFYGTFLTAVAGGIKLNSTGKLKSLVLPFPFSVLAYQLPGHKFPETVNVPTGVPFIPQLSRIITYPQDLRNSYSQQISFGLERQISNNTIVAATYDFVRGIKLFAQRSTNPVVRPIIGDPLGSSLKGRVDPTKGEVLQFESSFDSSYHAVTFSITQRFSKKLTLLAHYTFSKTIDNFTDFRAEFQETVDPLKIKDERGLSIQDVRSRLVTSATYDTGKTANIFLRNTQLSTIVNLNSSRPYNLLAGIDLNRNADSPPGDRPLIGGTSIGRNTGITPGFASVDLKITRSVSIKESYKLQAFMEVFNLFNRVNISDFDRIYPPDAQGNFTLPVKSGGRFTVPQSRFRNAFSPRQIQFGFRLSF